MRPLLVLLGLAAVVGCVKSAAVECADGTLCPEGTICDPISSTCVEPGGLVISEGLVDLGSLRCGSTIEHTLTLSNFGDDAISFVADSTIELVSLSPASGSVEPGGRLDVTLTADATGTLPIGDVEGAVYFTTDAGLVPRIVQLTIDGALMRTSHSAVDFGIASLTQPPGSRTFQIFNDGSETVDVTIETPDLPFSVSPDPVTVAGGGFADVEVDFNPNVIGIYSSDLAMSFAGPVCQLPTNMVKLSGEISDAPLLVNTTIVDFGTTPCSVGASSSEITFTNNLPGDQTLSFALSGGDAALYQESAPVVVVSSLQQTTTVDRLAIGAPHPTGKKSAQLMVTAAPSGETLSIDLQHDVVGPVLALEGGRINFGLVETFSVATRKVTITNSGNAPALVQATPASQTTPDGGSVRVEPASFTVMEGQAKSVDVVVTTLDGGYATSGLVFDLDSSGQCSRLPVITVDYVVGGMVETP